MESSDEHMTTTVRIAQFLQGGFLATVFIYAYVLMVVKKYISLALVNDAVLGLVTAVLAVIGVVVMALGLVLPRWAMRHRQVVVFAGQLHSLMILRCSLFASVAIYGLVLGLMGARWVAVLPFLIASVAAMILTFPSKGGWRKLAGVLTQDSR